MVRHSNNMIEGPLPDVTGLHDLEELDLSFNFFYGMALYHFARVA